MKLQQLDNEINMLQLRRCTIIIKPDQKIRDRLQVLLLTLRTMKQVDVHQMKIFSDSLRY